MTVVWYNCSTMGQPTRTKVKNGSIALPQEVGKSWSNREVMVFSDDNRIIIEPVESEWDEFEKRAEKGKENISLELIDEAVQWAKKNA